MITWIDQNIIQCQTWNSQHLAQIIKVIEKNASSITIKSKELPSWMIGTNVPNWVFDSKEIMPCLQILVTTTTLKAKTCYWTYVTEISIRGIPKYLFIQPLCYKSRKKLQYVIPYDRNDFYSLCFLYYWINWIIMGIFTNDRIGPV